MLTDFQNSFTFRFSSICVMRKSRKSHHTSNASLHYLATCKCQETTAKLKEMSHLTINFYLIHYTFILFFLANLCHGEYSKCGSNAGMWTSAPVSSDIVNNAGIHSNSFISTRCHLKLFTSCWSASMGNSAIHPSWVGK